MQYLYERICGYAQQGNFRVVNREVACHEMRSEASHVAVPRYSTHVTDRVSPDYFLFPSATTCQPFSSLSQDRFHEVSRRPCTQLSTGKHVDRARRQYSSSSGERTGESKCVLFSPIRDSGGSSTTLPLSCSSHLLSPTLYRFALVYISICNFSPAVPV
jgi:hypothetical protein